MAAISGFLKSLVVKNRANELLELKWRASGVVDAAGNTMQAHIDNTTTAKHVTAEQLALLTNKNAANGVLVLGSDNKIPSEYLAGLGTLSTDLSYDTIALRDAASTTGLVSGNTCFVADATGDSSVKTGWAIYRWSGTAWMKIMEQESMDITVSNAWADITGKPSSTPAAIDTAVTTSALRVSDVVTAVPTEWPADVRADGVLFFVES